MKVSNPTAEPDTERVTILAKARRIRIFNSLHKSGHLLSILQPSAPFFEIGDNRIQDIAQKRKNGVVEIGSISFGCFKPIELLH